MAYVSNPNCSHFCKIRFIGTQPRSFIYLLPVAAFNVTIMMLQHCLVAPGLYGPQCLKYCCQKSLELDKEVQMGRFEFITTLVKRFKKESV